MPSAKLSPTLEVRHSRQGLCSSLPPWLQNVMNKHTDPASPNSKTNCASKATPRHLQAAWDADSHEWVGQMEGLLRSLPNLLKVQSTEKKNKRDSKFCENRLAPAVQTM